MRKKRIKKRGFTLIEMLATVVILGVIGLIATPVVTNIVNDAKVGAFKRSVEGITTAIDNKYAVALLAGNVEETSYIYADGKSTLGDLDKYFKGKRPDEAIFHINTNGEMEYVIYDKELKVCASKSFTSDDYKVTKDVLDKNKCIGKLSINLLTDTWIHDFKGLKKYEDKIISADFVDHMNIPEGAITYDMSLDKDGSIIGWLESVGNDRYKLYIGSEGKIYSSTNFSPFFDMRALETVNLENLNTINATNMSGLFEYCVKLKRIYNIQNLDTRNVTDMGYMFVGCESLEELDVSHFDTSNVETMYVMFDDLKKVPVLDVSHFNTSKVTNMYGMFSDCNSVKVLDVSHFDTSKVTDMARMFHGCNSVTNLDLSNFNTSKVTTMNYMFWECSSLSNLNISSFDTRNVTDFQGTFARLSGLTSELNLSTLNTSKATNMLNMFADYPLASLDLSNFDTSKVTTMDGMFSQSENLTSLDLSNFNTSNVNDMYGMFFGLHALRSINLSSFNTSKVTNMKWMFNQCSNLTELDISSFNIGKVTDMEEIFASTPKLNVVYVNSNWDTSNVKNKKDMFSASKINHVTVKSTN